MTTTNKTDWCNANPTVCSRIHPEDTVAQDSLTALERIAHDKWRAAMADPNVRALNREWYLTNNHDIHAQLMLAVQHFPHTVSVTIRPDSGF